VRGSGAAFEVIHACGPTWGLATIVASRESPYREYRVAAITSDEGHLYWLDHLPGDVAVVHAFPR
jgi:hypothetical protein